MPNLAKYVVQLEAQTAKYQKELDKANSKLSRFNRRQTSTLNQITIAFKRLAPAVGLVGFGALIKRSVDTADNFQKLTDRLGSTTEAFSELDFVGQRSGVQFRTLSIGLQRLQRRVAEAAGGFGEARDALKELNIDAVALSELPIDKQFEVVADRLFKVEKQSDKTRLAMKLFDSEGVALLQTMTKGAAGIRELRERARELGVTLDSDVARQAVIAKDRLTDFDARVKSAARNVSLALVPSLTNAVTRLEEFSIGIAAAFFNASPEAFGKEILDAQDKLDGLISTVEFFEEQGFKIGDGVLEPFLADIEKTKVELSDLKKKSLESFDEPAAVLQEVEFGLGDVDTEIKGLDAFIKRFQTAEQSVERNLTELEKFKAALSPEEFKRIGDAIREELVDGLDEIEVTSKKIVPETKKAFDAMAAFADQAARNMQDAFADFLFDPFEDGLRGMLRSFLDTLRRMIANQLASQIFGAFNIGGLLGRAAGGPVSAGTPFLVGERGPEVFVPQAAGNIVANNKLGGNTFNFFSTVNAGMGSNATELNRLMDERDQKLKSEFLDELDRGQFE